MQKEVVQYGTGRFLGLEDFGLDLLPDGFFLFLEFFGFVKAGVDHGLFEEFQGVTGGSGEGDFFAVAVGGAGVRHGVSVVTVGHHFDVHGSVAGSAVVLDVAHALGHGQDVHAVDADTGNGIAHFVIIGNARMTVHGGPHAVVVVFNAKNHGEFPERRHVGCLPYLSLVGSPVTVTSNGDLHLVGRSGVVFVGKGQTGSDGDLGTDNAGASEKVILFVVKVHGSALALGIAVGHAKQFTNDLLDGPSPGQRHAVTTVGSDPAVFEIQRVINAGRHRFLAVVQVTETTNGPGLVLVVASNLHTTHRVHQLKHVRQILLGKLHSRVGHCLHVVNLYVHTCTNNEKET